MGDRTIASRLTHVLQVEREVRAKGFDRAGESSWELFDEIFAEVQDALPSRADRLDTSMDASRRPARVRIRYRTDITRTMRFVEGDRVMRIVAGPAEIGRRELLEFMVEDYSPAANGA